MAVDGRIALGFQRPEYHSPINSLGNALQVQGQLQRNRLAEMEMREAEAARERTGALRNRLASIDITTPEGQSTLAREFPLEAPKIIEAQLGVEAKRGGIAKDAAQTKKAEVDAEGAKLKQRQDAITFNLQALGAVTNPQQAQQWIQGGVQSGLISPEQAQASLSSVPQDPQGFEQWKQRQMAAGMTLAQQAEQAMKQREFAYRQTNDAANRSVQIRGQDVSAATQRRGQDMVDARTRDNTAAAVTKPFEVTGPDGMPMLVQQDRQGNIKPVQGFGPRTGASKPLTDTQAKALLFGTRAQESDKIIAGIGDGYSPMAINTKSALGRAPVIGGALEAGANMVIGDTNQQAEQAQRDFINAVLRRESGAVISDSEFDNARKQYFPQPGDSKSVLDQKAKNRRLAISGMLAEVPEGRRNSITPSGGATGGWEGWSIEPAK